MNTITPVHPLQDTPGMPRAIGNTVKATDGLVCATCGLGNMGHAPESSWLGHSPHPWVGVPGDATRADELTNSAYAARCARELCGAYCISTHAN